MARTWDPRLNQISDLAYSGNTEQAAALAQSYLKENPEDPNAYFMRAMVYDWKRNLSDGPGEDLKEKSYQLYKKGNQIAFFLWEKNPDNPDALIDLGNSYILLGRIMTDQGKWFRAIMTAKKGPKHLEKALALAPERTDGLMTLGVFHFVADNTPPAAAPFKKLFGIKGSETEGLRELKKALTGNHPFKNDALVALYYMHFNFDKKYTEAAKYVDLLAQKFPDNPQWPFAKAEIAEKQNKALAITAYLEVVDWCEQKHPNRCAKKYLYDSLYRAGMLAKVQKRYDEAMAHLQKSIATGLTDHPHQHAQALIWMGEMSTDPALAYGYYRKAAELKGVPKELNGTAKERLAKICEEPAPGAVKVCKS